MSKIRSFSLVAVLALLVACGTTPNQTAYRTVATTRVSVTEAMGFWNVYVGQFHPSADKELLVKNAFEKWQAAQIVVCDMGALYSATVTTNTAGSTGVSGLLENAIANAAQDRQDLLDLLTRFGVKL